MTESELIVIVPTVLILVDIVQEPDTNLNKEDIRTRNFKTKEPNQHDKLDSGFKWKSQSTRYL
jgi:hypothetical protein